MFQKVRISKVFFLIWDNVSDDILTSRLWDLISSVTAQWASWSRPLTFIEPKVIRVLLGGALDGLSGDLVASLVLWVLVNLCLCFSGE